jgi:hypothetical protein
MERAVINRQTVTEYVPDAGESIQRTTARMVQIARRRREVVKAYFNGTPLRAIPTDDAETIRGRYYAARDQAVTEWKP